MLLLSLALQAAVAAPAAPPADPRDIVVTATRLEATERAWKDCRKRDCPPDEEIRAALAHAENQFIAGRYDGARGTLYATINSTRGAEKRFPVLVGDLRRAEARVSTHLGETGDVRVGMVASRDALATGLGEDDPRTLAQRLLIADAIMVEEIRPPQIGGQFRYNDHRESALRTYEKVAQDALRLGYTDLYGRALLRRVGLFARLAAVDFAYRDDLRRSLKRLADTTDAKLAPYREAGELFEAKLAANRGDEAAVELLVANSKPVAPGELPPLIHAPAISMGDSRDFRTDLRSRLGGEAPVARVDQWVDIGFAIGADGRVRDVDVLRESANRDGNWIDPVMAAIRGRRYARTEGADASFDLQRVERYTYTASWGTPLGSGIRKQVGIPRVVMLDITAETPRPSPAAPAAAAPAPQLTPAAPTR